MIKKLHLSQYGILVLGVLTLPLIYFMSRYSYNLFHSLADGLTIVIAACAFVVVWNSRRNIDNDYFTYVGISLLFFAFLDLIHMLGNKNMGVFPGYGNLGPTFYIASRYLLSISLVIAPLFINRRLNTSLMFVIYSLATIFILLSVFHWNVFPVCIIEGVGLTPFKVISDYVICLILLGAMGLLLINRRSFDSRVLRTLVFSIVLSIATGLMFTLYTDPFGVTNLVGHLFQIGSFYLVYVAIIETSLIKPQEILFRKLKQNEEKLTENVRQLDRTNVELQQEIAERKRTEKALRESEERFMKVFYESPSAMTITRPSDQTLIDANDSFLSLFEFSREDAVGRRVVADLNVYVNPDADRERILRLFSGHGKVPSLEVRMRTKTGKVLTVLFSSEMINFSGEGSVACTTIIDITERKKTEEALQESERRLTGVLESMPDAFVSFDNDMRYTYVNANAKRLQAARRDELLGKDVRTVYPDEESAKTISQYEGVIREQKPLTLTSYHAGFDRWVEVRAFPTPEGVSVFYKDVSAQVKAEQELRRAHDELELRVAERTSELRKAYSDLVEQTRQREMAEAQLRQAQKMEALGTLSGGIAHDFNNLLAAIIGFTELAAEHAPAGSRDEHYLHRVMEASLRGRELVKQMLTFSRSTAEEKKPLLLSSIVKETARLLRATTPTTISIKVTIQSESGLILGDPTQIQQILMNLCTNATYAMREKGGILAIELGDFSVAQSSGNNHGIEPGLYMKLTVRDTGSGISQDIIDKIFDPFFTTKKLGEGTGLGLSVVHGIVKSSGGYITVESAPGKGSAFTVYFPKTAGEEKAAAPGLDMIPTGSERVLFVDDEEAIVEMSEDILAELGYEVTSRTSSKAALALLKENPSRFDLVITDQTMPEMTGVEFARQILVLRPDIPVILCTGFSHLIDAEGAKATGIRAFAMKPLTKREIARTIRKVLEELAT